MKRFFFHHTERIDLVKTFYHLKNGEQFDRTKDERIGSDFSLSEIFLYMAMLH
jgi:hypothetical protein